MKTVLSAAIFAVLLSTNATAAPTVVTQDRGIVMMLVTFLVVWLAGGWYFSQMLHQTAFGTARADVPYTDLRILEIVAVSVLLIGATYSGLVH